MTNHPNRSAAAKLERALSRRYGKSLLPYEISPWGDGDPNRWLCRDAETGIYIIATLQAGRLRVLDEHDPAA